MLRERASSLSFNIFHLIRHRTEAKPDNLADSSRLTRGKVLDLLYEVLAGLRFLSGGLLALECRSYLLDGSLVLNST